MFLCKLGITLAAVLFNKNNTKTAIYISTSVAFTIFICIIFHHTVKRLLSTKHGSKIKAAILSILQRKERDTGNQDVALVNQLVSDNKIHSKVTYTTVELKEPLLHVESDQQTYT